MGGLKVMEADMNKRTDPLGNPLPPCVYFKSGTYYRKRDNKWTPLGKDYHEALAESERLQAMPNGSVGWLIETAMKAILPSLKPATAYQYHGQARKLHSVFGAMRIIDVKPRHLAQLKLQMAATPNMANQTISLARQIFGFALEWQLIDSNPAVGIKRHKVHTRKRLITMPEYQSIYALADARLQCIMDLLIHTGQRISDVLAISRADLVADGIRFCQEKTEAKLIVSWTPELRAIVERAKGLDGNVAGLSLFRNRRGKRPAYTTTRYQWEKLCRKVGVVDAHLHDLRAMCLTEADAQGMNATKLAGHSSPAMTARYLRAKQEPVVTGPRFPK